MSAPHLFEHATSQLGRGPGNILHLRNKSILINPLSSLGLRLLRPHLLDVLEDHVAMSVEGLDSG